MAQAQANLDTIQADLRSTDAETRSSALRELFLKATQDPAIRPAALPLFRAALQSRQTPAGANKAVDGIALIAGRDEARGYRLALLQDHDMQTVRMTLLSIDDPACAPAMIETISLRPELDIRIAGLRQLGRIAPPLGFAVLKKYLDDPPLRPHVVEAFADLRDPRAIPLLEPLLEDKTAAWPIDNHGPMLRVCDLAKESIDRLRGTLTGPNNAPRPAAPPMQPGPIRLIDANGQQMTIARSEWREKVLPHNLKKVWGQPNELYGIIVDAINNGFRPDILDAAQHLYLIDTDRLRGANLWAVILIEEGKLDEAEAILRDYLAQSGQTGVILASLAKVYLRRGNTAEAEKIYWQAFAADPNQQNGIATFSAMIREKSGEAAELDALRKIAALPGSWRAQVDLAKKALDAGHLDQALALYRDALARAAKPIPSNLLMQMSADLGGHGHPAEAVALVAPVYGVHAHGMEVGNNLIKAYLELHQPDAARQIMNQLYAVQRPDWRPTLDYWNARLGQSPPVRQSPPVLMPSPHPPRRVWPRFIPFLPLICAGLEIPWFVVIVLGILFVAGDEPYTMSTQQENVLTAIAAFPAAVGIFLGILVILRHWPPKKYQRIFLILGLIICLFIVAADVRAIVAG
jgi:tetratricopeptide (TPR) repeat protein